jgi:plastocyanin
MSRGLLGRGSSLASIALLLVACAGGASTNSPMPVPAPTLLQPSAPTKQIPSDTVVTPTPVVNTPFPTSAGDSGAAATATLPPNARRVRITMRMLDFSFDPSQLNVQLGDLVHLELRNEGNYPHSFMLPEFAAASPEVPPGGTVALDFVADKSGNYTYYCPELDPFSHYDAGMWGTLTVGAAP